MNKTFSGMKRRISHAEARELIKLMKPACFILYAAGWANGYTVNGIKPPLQDKHTKFVVT